MTPKNAAAIFAGLLCLWILELVIYFSTGMARALGLPGLAMAAAYKFLWLMVLTAAAALLAPVAAFIESFTEKEQSGLFWWTGLVGLVMIGFTTLTYLKAPVTPLPVPQETKGQAAPPVKPAAVPLPQAPAPPGIPAASGQKITDTVEFSGATIVSPDAESLVITLQFRNKSGKTITEMDYLFMFVDGTRLLMRIPMREDVYIPPGVAAETSLTWKKSNFKEAAAFDELYDAYTRKTAKAVAAPSRALLDDGTQVGGK